ncbi:hypothetical protein [Pseudoclavibacter helvolus]|uniref:hypothetical protein n=1 Tax=Pseudoclavibacter helvolus TaxID=255205 RepID=UPI003735B19D
MPQGLARPQALTARGAAELRDLRERAAVPLALRRRVGVASLAVGAGCTTIAVELARFLAAVRRDRVRFVSAQGASARPERGLDGTRVESLELSPTQWPADVDAWWRLHRASSDAYDLTVTDWGATPLARIRDLAEHSHVVCLVTPADRASIQRALDVAAAVGANTRVVLVAVDIQRVAGLATEKLVDNLPFPSVLVRHDRMRNGTSKRGLDGVRMLRLGARVIDAAAGVAAPPVPVPVPVPVPASAPAPPPSAPVQASAPVPASVPVPASAPVPSAAPVPSSVPVPPSAPIPPSASLHPSAPVPPSVSRQSAPQAPVFPPAPNRPAASPTAPDSRRPGRRP